MNDRLEEELIALERRLLLPEVRASRAELDRLIDDSFLEFGASGVRFGKQEALRRLPVEEPPEFGATDFEARRLAPDVMQVIYRGTIKRPGEDETHHSLRSSIWRRNGGQWQMVFHQGTPCKP